MSKSRREVLQCIEGVTPAESLDNPFLNESAVWLSEELLSLVRNHEESLLRSID